MVDRSTDKKCYDHLQLEKKNLLRFVAQSNIRYFGWILYIGNKVPTVPKRRDPLANVKMETRGWITFKANTMANVRIHTKAGIT